MVRRFLKVLGRAFLIALLIEIPILAVLYVLGTPPQPTLAHKFAWLLQAPGIALSTLAGLDGLVARLASVELPPVPWRSMTGPAIRPTAGHAAIIGALNTLAYALLLWLPLHVGEASRAKGPRKPKVRRVL